MALLLSVPSEATAKQSPVAEDEALPSSRSVVAPAYKSVYAERAAARARTPKGVPKKLLKHGCGDWLHTTLLAIYSRRLSVDEFTAILDANGVRHSHLKREGNGWQGRLRMTGRLALQAEVADAGRLFIPDHPDAVPPKTWIASIQR